jgi:hypothetical protein
VSKRPHSRKDLPFPVIEREEDLPSPDIGDRESRQVEPAPGEPPDPLPEPDDD